MQAHVLLIAALEEAIARFLSLDEKRSDYLQPLIGKVIELDITSLNIRLYLCPTPDGIQLFHEMNGQADVVFSGSAWAFASMSLSDSPKKALFSGKISIEGDVQVARHFQALFEKIDIDWQSILAKITGETLASGLMDFFKSSHAWRKESFETFKLNMVEYLQEETRDLPAAAEAELFFSDIDVLRADCDRLEARIERLKNQIL